ncbi:MAG: hypothetical protein AAF432_13510 [Planctomycetota bacterium]
MRTVLNWLGLLVVLLVAAGIIMHELHQRARTSDHRIDARLELRRIERQLTLQSELLRRRQAERAYPLTIDPTWFPDGAPLNPMLDLDRPWMEIASVDERFLLHPIDRVATTSETAMYWYNPYLGIVRSRVPQGFDDHDAIACYNDVNDVDVSSLTGEIRHLALTEAR